MTMSKNYILSNKKEKLKLEVPFDYKFLITCKYFFTSEKLCKLPPNVSYPYADITLSFVCVEMLCLH